MDISGPPTAPPESFRDSAPPQTAWRRAITVLGLAAGTLAGGCALPVMKAGAPPPVERLAQLKVAVSNASDVRSALGEPQGRGAVRLPQTGLQEIWLYEYDEVEGAKVRLRMLMVFVDKDSTRYGGYMWFSSGQLLALIK
jgi:hypothetical protein